MQTQVTCVGCGTVFVGERELMPTFPNSNTSPMCKSCFEKTNQTLAGLGLPQMPKPPANTWG